MSVRDKWPFSRYEGWVRVETRPYTASERRQVQQGTVLILIGFLSLAITQDWPATVFAMLTAGVFVQILQE